MNDIQKTIIVPAEELDFDSAPTFCVSGDPSVTGKGLRANSDARVTSPGKEDVTVRPGGVLLKIQDNSLMFVDGENFTKLFSRLLKNGETVKLSKPVSVQLAEIRHAEDATHLKDVGVLMGTATLENVVGFVDGLKSKAANSETAQQLREAASDFKTEMGATYADAKSELQKAINSPTAKNVRSRLKGLMWGKFGKGKESNNG